MTKADCTQVSSLMLGLVATWTAGHDPAAAAAILVGVGVPAHAVQNSGECAVDEQLLFQNHFVTVPHAEHGTVVVEASRLGNVSGVIVFKH